MGRIRPIVSGLLVLLVLLGFWQDASALVDIKRADLVTRPGRLFFGASVAMTGNTLAVASFADNAFEGAIFIYELENGDWMYKQKIQPSEVKAGDQFSWSFDINGNRLVGGSVGRKTDGVKRGKSYYFQRDGPGMPYVQKQSLLGNDKQDGDLFGYSTTVKSRRLFVTAEQGKTTGGSNGTGKVYYYKYGNAAGKWNLKQVIKGDKFHDQFGDETEYANKRLLIGAPFASNKLNGIADTGAAYVYRFANGKFTREAKLNAPDSRSKDSFGTNAVLSGEGTTAVVGANRASGPNTNDQGAAYVFELISGSWQQTDTLYASNGHDKSWFGYAILWTPEVLYITSYKQKSFEGNNKEAGLVYVFKKNKRGKFKESTSLQFSKQHEGDQFGNAIATNGEFLAVTAPRYDTNNNQNNENDTGKNDGAVQMFSTTTNPGNAINFLPRPFEVPTSGSLLVKFEYRTSATAIIRAQVRFDGRALFKAEKTYSRGSGFGEIRVPVNGLTMGTLYPVRINLIQNNRVIKKRSEKYVKAVRP